MPDLRRPSSSQGAEVSRGCAPVEIIRAPLTQLAVIGPASGIQATVIVPVRPGGLTHWSSRPPGSAVMHPEEEVRDQR